MQFTQPGFSSYPYGQPFAYNIPFQLNGYPEVIGEGNVTSVMLPDGSMQLLFLPTAHWWKPCPYNDAGYVNNTNWNPPAAWFIRSVFGPIQPMPCQAPNTWDRTYNLNSCVNVNQPSYTPPFELKFHNDISTSTSDIHYFYPNLRPWNVQVDVPMVTSQSPCEVMCVKPCYCAPLLMMKPKNTKEICRCRKTSDASIRDISCETDMSDEDRRQEKNSRKQKSKPKKKNIVICECTEPETTDKCVTTFTDQGAGCAAEEGCETQTANSNGRETQTGHAACDRCDDNQTAGGSIPVNMVNSTNLSRRDIKTELWIPITPESKKVMQIESSRFTGVCESSCCSGICSCQSDTD